MTAQTNPVSDIESNEAQNLAAGTNELIAAATDIARPEDNETEEAAPSTEAQKVAFNVYVSDLPETRGRVFSILYYNPLHVYPAEGEKDTNVVRLYTRRPGMWNEARGWLSAVTDYMNGKYPEMDPAGYLFRLNGNLIISVKLFNQLAKESKNARGIWTVDGIRDGGLKIVKFSGVREDQLWLEFAADGDNIFHFWGALNGTQVLYYMRMMKLAAGANVYFRQLDSRVVKEKQKYELRAETKAAFCNARGDYFFKQPLIVYYCSMIGKSPEEARQIANDHIQASKQRKAINGTAFRATQDAASTGEMAVMADTKLFLQDESKCKLTVQHDDKDRAFITAADLTTTTKLYGFNANKQLVVYVEWKVLPDVDTEKANQEALRKIQAANGVKWAF